MGRIAFIVLAVIVVLIWFKLKIRDGERNDEAGRRPDRKKRAVEHMVACSHCGVHVPIRHRPVVGSKGGQAEEKEK